MTEAYASPMRSSSSSSVEAPEQRVLAQEGHHALTLGVGRTELGVRHAAPVWGVGSRECKIGGQVSG